MMRPAAACLIGLALLFCGPSAAVAKKRHASKCQKLAKRYADIATSRTLVTVVRGNDETGAISACVLPRGKVRTLTSWDDGLGRQSAAVVATAGTWVLVSERWGDQYGGLSRVLTRHDARHGTPFGLSGYGCQIPLGSPGSCSTGTDFSEVGLARTGAGAIELDDFETNTTTLQAFDAAGTFTKLADGPIDHLRVTSTQITWSQGGTDHAAPLPG
jgi:hypothetical protein